MSYLRTFIRIISAIKTRPTKLFFLVIVSIIVLFLQAYMHNYNIVFLVMFFIFSLAGASSIIGRLNLYYLVAELLSHDRFFAKRGSTFHLKVGNPTDWTVYDITYSHAQSAHTVERIEAHNTQLVALPIRFDRRGLAMMPRLKLLSRYPLPHELLFRYIDLREEVVVYPEPKGMPLQELLAQEQSITGEFDDFEGIKRYDASESIARIYWPSLAKQGDMMSKQFRFSSPNELLEFHFTECADNDEARLSQLTLWVIECEKLKRDFTIVMPYGRLDSTEESSDAILEKLARY